MSLFNTCMLAILHYYYTVVVVVVLFVFTSYNTCVIIVNVSSGRVLYILLYSASVDSVTSG